MQSTNKGRVIQLQFNLPTKVVAFNCNGIYQQSTWHSIEMQSTDKGRDIQSTNKVSDIQLKTNLLTKAVAFNWIGIYSKKWSCYSSTTIWWHLKGLVHDLGLCLFTKIIWNEILIEFLQKVIQKCTNHFGKDWAINRAEITHKSL